MHNQLANCNDPARYLQFIPGTSCWVHTPLSSSSAACLSSSAAWRGVGSWHSAPHCSSPPIPCTLRQLQVWWWGIQVVEWDQCNVCRDCWACGCDGGHLQRLCVPGLFSQRATRRSAPDRVLGRYMKYGPTLVNCSLRWCAGQILKCLGWTLLAIISKVETRGFMWPVA